MYIVKTIATMKAVACDGWQKEAIRERAKETTDSLLSPGNIYNILANKTPHNSTESSDTGTEKELERE